MKSAFFPRLAWQGITKNRRMYLPFLLASGGMAGMFYIMDSLADSALLNMMKGGGVLTTMLNLGRWVIAIFSCIFLFYTHSFLIRRRKKEFGLYNILGMDKRNLGRLLFWENLIVLGITLAIGLLLGMAFSKIAELMLVKIIQQEASYALTVSLRAMGDTALIFAAIDVLLLLNSLRQVRFSTAIALLKSETVGEKTPKANGVLGILGILCISAGYYLSVSITDPVAALVFFFVAVILVILGTYLLLISSSVLFCRLLQKNKGYYYRPSHFVSVSSMVYRMKRNGAGLASICILATMVLVTVSSTTTLYFGSDNALDTRYPRQFSFNIGPSDDYALTDADALHIENALVDLLKEEGVELQNFVIQRSMDFQAMQEQSNLSLIKDNVSYSDSRLVTVILVPQADYNRTNGTSLDLAEDECAIYSYHKDYAFDTFCLEGMNEMTVVKNLDGGYVNGFYLAYTNPLYTVVVKDLSLAQETQAILLEHNGYDGGMTMAFDTDLDDAEQLVLYDRLWDWLGSDYERQNRIMPWYEEHGSAYSIRNVVNERSDFYDTYGGLFFIGILLSMVFLLAAILIIYYKQISEGYEDQSRFEIMQKVGMTKQEIRRSINSQLLTVFFLPLVLAGLHLAFAFPIIQKLLLLFGLTNVKLFILTTLGSFGVFALFYALVYRITSNAYYNIVSGAKPE